MKIDLIRHGKTDANRQHLYCGSTDLPLSEEGKQELYREKPDKGLGCRYISSGMKRCNETLQILFEETAYEVIPEFREIDFGEFEMRGYEELKEDPAYQEWLKGDNDVNCPPGGESGNQMKARVLAAFEAVADRNEDAVVVTHGGVIAAIMEELFREERKNRYQWQPKPGNGYRLEGNGKTWKYHPLCEERNKM